MKLNFNCAVWINKSGKTSFFISHLFDFDFPKREFNICILNLFRRVRRESKFFKFPLSSKFLHLLYPSSNKLRKVSKEPFGKEKQATEECFT